MEILVNRNGEQLGPYSLEQVHAALAAGQLNPTDLGWHEGLGDWQPLSSLLKTRTATPTAVALPVTEPLSVWALALGILSWLCAPLAAGIPAIICGHKGLGRIKRNPALQGKGMAVTGLILGYISTAVSVVLLVLFAFGVVFATVATADAAREKAKLQQKLNNARRIQMVMSIGAIDAGNSGDKSTAWPADAGITSAPQLKRMLVSHDYLTEEDLKKINFDDFLIGNVSDDDPSDTILIKSKPGADKAFIVFRKGGDGEIYTRSGADVGKDPPRTPAYLSE